MQEIEYSATMIIPLAISLLVVLCLVPIARKLALQYGFVDIPDNSRKQHDAPIPPVGGLVIVPVFFAVTFFFSSPLIMEHWPFWIGLFLVWGTSAIDDKVHVNSGIRFGVQLISACLLVIGNETIVRFLGDLFGLGNIWMGPFAFPFSILCVCLVINAMNMIDGLDGLCGGVAFIMLIGLFTAANIMGQHELLLPMSVIIGCLFGFLVYNYRHPFRKKASIFMGDSGSAALGLILSWFVIELTQWPDQVTPGHIDPIVIAWVLALPVFDALSLFAYRLKNKRHPFTPDRRHLHYLLKDNGFSVSQTVGIILGGVCVYSAIGIMGNLYGVPHVILMCIWILCFFIHGLVIFGVISSPRISASNKV